MDLNYGHARHQLCPLAEGHMALKTSLDLKLGQQLTLTPQLQQAIFLLQLTSTELQQQIQQALESNPLLETEEEINEEPTKEEQQDYTQNQQSAQKTSKAAPDNIDSLIDQQAEDQTLHDYLTWQMNFLNLNQANLEIANTLIEAIDDNGFLTCTLENLQVLISINPTIDQIKNVLFQIQSFDPAGVGARDLQECLTLQIRRLDADRAIKEKALLIITNDFTKLAGHDYAYLQQLYHLDQATLSQVIHLIQGLNPRPGALISGNKADYIIPDVIVNKTHEKWVVRLNEDILPHIRINDHYANMINKTKSDKDSEYLRNNLQEARWLLRSLKNRNETLLKVATYIVKTQQQFLHDGETVMRPLVIREVASAIGMHESTISRVTTGKYIMTPQGIYELKYFFSSQLNTLDGNNCSSTAIRAVIKNLIEKENPKKPLSDQKLTEKLREQGIDAARRTIAKYREALGIPPSSKRKTL